MRSAHTREQDFMAITAEVEVLCQQLKGRGMYTVYSTPSTTNSAKSGGSVHFQPINLAPEVISPGHGPVTTKLLDKPTR